MSGVQITKKADAVVVPAPPEIVGEGPEAILRGSDEAVEGTGFADHRGDLVGGFDELANLRLSKDAWLFGLEDEDADEYSAVDERDA